MGSTVVRSARIYLTGSLRYCAGESCCLRTCAHRTWRAQAYRLRGVSFAKVFNSPLQRATRTWELAGFGALPEIDRDLLEWNYGEYEGRMIPNVGGFISCSPGALSIFFRSRNLMR